MKNIEKVLSTFAKVKHISLSPEVFTSERQTPSKGERHLDLSCTTRLRLEEGGGGGVTDPSIDYKVHYIMPIEQENDRSKGEIHLRDKRPPIASGFLFDC